MEESLFFTLYFLTAVIWIRALTDLINTKFEKRTMKGLWLMAILLFPIIGSLAYFQVGRKSASGHTRKFQPDFTDFDNKQLV